MPQDDRNRQGALFSPPPCGEGSGVGVAGGSTTSPQPPDPPPRPSPTSGEGAERRDDPYGWIDRFASDLHVAARDLVRDGEAFRVSDEAVARIMTAAIRLYVAKSDGEERTFRPIVGDDNEPLTATELLSAVSELLRALRLGPMELALWYRRRPDEP
jgi:hypothetical protein